jgi:hypothetical protein
VYHKVTILKSCTVCITRCMWHTSCSWDSCCSVYELRAAVKWMYDWMIISWRKRRNEKRFQHFTTTVRKTGQDRVCGIVTVPSAGWSEFESRHSN